MTSRKLRPLRRVCQGAVFALFVFLFLVTEYKDNDVLPYAVNIFLRLDPLMAGAAALASRTAIALLWPALALTALTLFFGRFFCAWVCPLGATLDATSGLWSKRRHAGALPSWRRHLKFLLLAFLAASSLVSLQWVFLFDPLCILIRSLTFAVYPAVNYVLNGLFGALYETGLTPVTAVSEPVYSFLRANFLAFGQPFYRAAELTGFLFLLLVALEYFEKRFWCRNLCPLGALLGLLGRWGLWRRKVSASACTSCGACAKTCEMDAIPDDFLQTRAEECTLCAGCRDVCPEDAISHLKGDAPQPAPADLPRRRWAWALALGVVSTPFFKVNAFAKEGHPRRIRPPGALPEDEFLARCTRCGECMKVCIANGLQPAVSEAGSFGFWSPVLVPRVGYCEYNCTLCGQVCPTGAITRLERPEKVRVRLGLAEVDRSRCLPWKGDSECIVCEEHCPTPRKAILLREESAAPGGRVFKKPYVDEALCVGCGICETKCPLTDRSAIVVTARGETRATGERVAEDSPPR